MRYKIACSAERLGLLDPQMIESVVAANAFQIGRQYVAENRVRIVDANDTQISAAVIGHSGLYEQTIKLKDDHLVSKCSCTLSEEPMCRHCIAALLEYHRWTQPRQSQKGKASRPSATDADPANTPSAPPPSSMVPDVKLTDIMQFVAWLGPTFKAIESESAIPSPPHLEPGTVSTWIATITNLELRRRENQQALRDLQAEMRDREAYLDRLSQQLQTSIAEAKAAQVALHALQREATRYQTTLAQAAGLVEEVKGQETEIRTAARDLLEKATHLDTLTTSFHELTELLEQTLKQPPADT
ncbi:MAG: hypothetical protein NNA20_08605 [Nitrospira sp.]|nr:hypothetical protein [Nitrospira sp.]MCP9442642.1 hypothetical protein [Nitrospira sp.]